MLNYYFRVITLFASNTSVNFSNLSAYSEHPFPIFNINYSTGQSGIVKFNPGGGYIGVIVLLLISGYFTKEVLKNRLTKFNC